MPTTTSASIVHQQNAVRNELLRCLTSSLDQFAGAAQVEGKPGLIHQFMTAMKIKELWPVLPVTHGSKSLEEQMNAFSSLEIPIICADSTSYDTHSPPYVPSRNNGGGNVWGNNYESRQPSPRVHRSPSRAYTMRNSHGPTLRTVFDLSERLRSLCVGLCLDCSKGNDVCRSPHPDPWGAYWKSVRLWFGQETPLEESVMDPDHEEMIREGLAWDALSRDGW